MRRYTTIFIGLGLMMAGFISCGDDTTEPDITDGNGDPVVYVDE